jgi:NADH-ubiquinone oxidoreductase chain 5
LMYHRLASFTIDLALSDLGKRIYTYLNAKWFFDAVFNHYIVNKLFGLGMITSKVLDRGVIELLGPFGLTNSVYNGSRQISSLDTGIVTQYSLYMMIGLISITLLLFIPILSGISLDNLGDFRLILIYAASLFFLASGDLTSRRINS